MHDWNQVLTRAGRSAINGDALGHDDSVIPPDGWEVFDEELIEQLRTLLIAREAFSPVVDMSITSHATELTTLNISGRAAARVSMTGEPRVQDAPTTSDSTILAPVISVDQALPWREREIIDENDRLTLEQLANEMGKELAQQEDDFILNGDSDLDIDGLLSPTNATSSASSDWTGNPSTAYDDIKGMYMDMISNDIPADQIRTALFLHPDQKEDIGERFGSGSDTTVEDKVLDQGYVTEGEVYTTTRQTAGEATLIAMNPAFLKVFYLQDTQTEAFRQSDSDRSQANMGTWVIPALQVRHAEAFVKRTSIG